MVDIQATGELIKWSVNGITLILMIIAASMAVKKKNNLVLGVAIVGNLLVYFFTRSPLLCMIVSVACIIWAGMAKGSGQDKQPLKSSIPAGNKKKKMKSGPIIGLLLGIGLAASPVIGFVRGEASAGDPISLVLGAVGVFMIIINIICIAKGTDNLLAPAQTTSTTTTAAPASAPAAPIAIQTPPKEKSKTEENKVRCRFCKKLYSTEYNGCPYCKKK